MKSLSASKLTPYLLGIACCLFLPLQGVQASPSPLGGPGSVQPEIPAEEAPEGRSEEMPGTLSEDSALSEASAGPEIEKEDDGTIVITKPEDGEKPPVKITIPPGPKPVITVEVPDKPEVKYPLNKPPVVKEPSDGGFGDEEGPTIITGTGPDGRIQIIVDDEKIRIAVTPPGKPGKVTTY